MITLNSAKANGGPLHGGAIEVAPSVTLVVYGWTGNEPGTLSWVFPSVSAAINAARALRNAVCWLVVAGARAAGVGDVDEIRRSEHVLVERFA